VGARVRETDVAADIVVHVGMNSLGEDKRGLVDGRFSSWPTFSRTVGLFYNRRFLFVATRPKTPDKTSG
jgi:hypothetical protein